MLSPQLKIVQTLRWQSEKRSQGQMLSLLDQEGQDISWRATIYNVPRGVMAFAVRAGTNNLASLDNLARWGRNVNPTCPMEGCNSVGTLGHLLSSCPQQLDRYSYRHDSILLHLVTSIHRMKKENIEVYADLPGWQTNGGTVPHNMAMTEQRPDLVIINRGRMPTKITLVELTCCWDSKGAF